MAEYKDFIPSEGFFVKPNLFEGLFKGYKMYENNQLIKPECDEHHSSISYNKNDVVYKDYKKYKASTDVPPNTEIDALNSDNIPYWVHIGTTRPYSAYDISSKTTFETQLKSFEIRILGLPVLKFDTFFMMGVFAEKIEFFLYRQNTEIGRFEVDMEFRDRICISFSKLSPQDVPDRITVKVHSKKIGRYVFHNLGKVALIGTGWAQSLGDTLVAFSTGLTTTRKSEPNYLSRNVVEKSYETLKMQFLAKTPEEYMRIKYLLKQASATSHIIHGGLRNYDQEFIFGVVDGQAPLDYREINKFTINGAGVSFLETDPLKTQKSNEGWG